ncbi:hypothetical protein PAHAL_5G494200 [Panicum hallii]|uniref:Uncharacterized protein n=1 Tax=Panicum hallii TaxID=206008 RepID=A0A2S3HYB5_9POAL|nr:hypothetical protein PAHAL_5G494200 [Panicum hallii]
MTAPNPEIFGSSQEVEALEDSRSTSKQGICATYHVTVVEIAHAGQAVHMALLVEAVECSRPRTHCTLHGNVCISSGLVIHILVLLLKIAVQRSLPLHCDHTTWFRGVACGDSHERPRVTRTPETATTELRSAPTSALQPLLDHRSFPLLLEQLRPPQAPPAVVAKLPSASRSLATAATSRVALDQPCHSKLQTQRYTTQARSLQ